jgi:hypothetical protein
VAERIKWGRPTLAAQTAATVMVLASILRVTVMAAAAAVAVAGVASAAAPRERMGPPKQAAELDPHKPVDPDPGRA